MINHPSSATNGTREAGKPASLGRHFCDENHEIHGRSSARYGGIYFCEVPGYLLYITGTLLLRYYSMFFAVAVELLLSDLYVARPSLDSRVYMGLIGRYSTILSTIVAY